MQTVDYKRFRHELEWYTYFYVPSRNKVAICAENLNPCIVRYFSKERLLGLIDTEKWNTFSIPVYMEALKHFPQEVKDEQ